MAQNSTAGKREPAWKRLGLKIKKSLEDDPLAIAPVHLAGITTKPNDDSDKSEIESKKRKLDESEDDESIRKVKVTKKSKKAPKRKKLPKNKRPAPPEKDQLAYLRTFYKDKEHWKFSKQKQNWLLRNIRQIPDEYDDYLKAYLSTMKGGSRDRLIQEMKKVVEKWNVQIEIAVKELEKESEEVNKNEEEKKENDNEKEKKDDAEAEKKKKESNVDVKYAARAAALYSILAGEELELKGVEDKVGENDEGDEEEKEEPEKKNKKVKEKPSELVVEDIDVKDYVSKKDYRVELDDKDEDSVEDGEDKEDAVKELEEEGKSEAEEEKPVGKEEVEKPAKEHHKHHKHKHTHKKHKHKHKLEHKKD